MFEHFGMMDIFSGLRKYRAVVLSVIVIFTALFVGKFVIDSKKAGSAIVEVNDNDIYISSATYYVEPRTDLIGRSDSSLYRSMSDDYIALLNSDFCKKYILDNLKSKYSDRYIVDNSGLKGNTSPQNLNEGCVKELYQAKRASGSMLIEISSMTYSEELSKSVVDICSEFLRSGAGNNTLTSTAEIWGTASRSIKGSELANENIDKSDKRNIVKAPEGKKSKLISFIKKVILPVMIVVILCLAVIVCKGLISPTMNRISDFSRYDIAVIGEIKGYKKSKESK